MNPTKTDWRERWKRDDIGNVCRSVLTEAEGYMLEQFIETTIAEEREKVLGAIKKLRKPICRCMCEKNRKAMEHNAIIDSLLTSLK